VVATTQGDILSVSKSGFRTGLLGLAVQIGALAAVEEVATGLEIKVLEVSIADDEDETGPAEDVLTVSGSETEDDEAMKDDEIVEDDEAVELDSVTWRERVVDDALEVLVLAEDEETALQFPNPSWQPAPQ
jgi:hypothetical protein